MKFQKGDKIIMDIKPIEILGVSKSFYKVKSEAKKYPYKIDCDVADGTMKCCNNVVEFQEDWFPGNCHKCPLRQYGPRCRYLQNKYCPLHNAKEVG